MYYGCIVLLVLLQLPWLSMRGASAVDIVVEYVLGEYFNYVVRHIQLKQACAVRLSFFDLASLKVSRMDVMYKTLQSNGWLN